MLVSLAFVVGASGRQPTCPVNGSSARCPVPLAGQTSAGKTSRGQRRWVRCLWQLDSASGSTLRSVLLLAAVCVALSCPIVIAFALTVPQATPSTFTEPSGTPQQGTQAPARGGRPTGSGTAGVAGQVLSAQTGAPVRKAEVRLAPAEPGGARTAWTDTEGKYEFHGLPAGMYSMVAEKQGYLPEEWGAILPGDVGRPVRVRDGELAKNVDVRMTRAGAISGRVLDEFSDPVPLARVTVLRIRTQGGVRRLASIAADPCGTNDLGQFRVANLAAGTYFVAAAVIDRRSDVGAEISQVPTYFPAATRIEAAQAIKVAAGEEVANLDLTFASARLARISGTVFDPEGRPASSGAVRASPAFAARALTSGGVRVNGDGTFDIRALPPGEYVLSAWSRDSQGKRSEGRARVTLSGTDIGGVSIQMGPGGRVSGRVVSDGQTVPAQVSIVARRFDVDDGESPLPGPAGVGKDGTFTLAGLFGDVLFRIEGAPATWGLKSTLINGREYADSPMSFDGRESISDVQVVITDRFARVTGVATDLENQPASGAFVTLFAADQSRWGPFSRYQASSRAGDGGRFTVEGLPPGEYVAVALPGVRGYDLEDFDLLERLQRVGSKVTLSSDAGQVKFLSLKLMMPAER